MLLDVTLDLQPAAFDGDDRHSSGLSAWQPGHIPGSRNVDVATELSDLSNLLHFTNPTPVQLAAALAALGITPRSRVAADDAGDCLWAART